MKQSVAVETITPAIAKAMLAENTANRPIRKHRVTLYAQAIRCGQWLMTGEPIIFNGTSLINGQHRLMACIEAETPFTTVVVRGADEDSFSVVDSGMGRTPGDVLHHLGVLNYNMAAASAKLVMGYESGTMQNPALSLIATRQKIASEVSSHRDIYSAATSRANAVGAATNLNRSAAAAFFVLTSKRDLDTGDFEEGLETGANLDVGDARLALRSWAVNASRMTNAFHFASIIRAWNAYRSGRPLKLIKTWIRDTRFPTLEDAEQ